MAALADPDALLLVAEEEGDLVGMAAGHVHQPSTFSRELAVEISRRYKVQIKSDDERNREIFRSVRTLAAFIAEEKARLERGQ